MRLHLFIHRANRYLSMVILTLIPALASATVMGDLAINMKGGEWRELVTLGLSSSFLVSGSKTIMEYSQKGQWDPGSERFLFLSSGHNCPYKFVIYSAATNSWSTGPLPDTCFSIGHTVGGCAVHSYYLSALDPDKGKFYFNDGRFCEYTVATNSWRILAGNGTGQGGFGGLAFLKDKGILHVSAYGALYRYNHSSNTWSRPNTQHWLESYHNFALDNPIHHHILFGGGNNVLKVYQIDTAGALTRMADAPYALGTCNGNITLDPVTGHYIAYNGASGASMYEFNSVTNTWTALSTLPPSTIRGYFGCSIAAAPVSTYGVIMYLTPNGKVHLYKHESLMSSAEATERSAVSGDLIARPNPSHGIVRIQVPLKYSVKILNTRGQMVANLSGNRSSSDVATWDAKGMPNGVYVVQCAAGEHSRQTRIVLSR